MILSMVQSGSERLERCIRPMRNVSGRLSNSPLALNTLWMLVGNGTRVAIQAVYFVLIARILGPEDLGAFVGVVSLVGVLAPFAGLGSGNILVRNTSRDPGSFRACWGRGLVITAASAFLLTAAVLRLSSVLLPGSIPLAMVASVALADLLFTRVLDLGGQAFMAFQRLRRTAQLQVLLSLARLTAAISLGVTVPAATATTWAGLYLISSALSGTTAVVLVSRELGRPVFAWSRLTAELAEGASFSVGYSAHAIYNNLDKTLLARLATLDAAGSYGAAYRVIDVAFAPVISLLSSTYARFFQHGAGGIGGGVRLARRMLALAAPYGLAAGLILCLAAPSLSAVMGRRYDGVAEAVRWLSLLPALRSLHYLAADALTGAGFQLLRSAMQVVVASLNVVLNLWLIPLYSWRGAAWASLASDGLLALSLWVIVWLVLRGTAGRPAVTAGEGGEG